MGQGFVNENNNPTATCVQRGEVSTKVTVYVNADNNENITASLTTD
jgi:hypothetical protein